VKKNKNKIYKRKAPN